MDIKIEKYSKEKEISYTFGAFPTFELIKNKPESALMVVYHTKLKITEEIENLFKLCKECNGSNCCCDNIADRFCKEYSKCFICKEVWQNKDHRNQ